MTAAAELADPLAVRLLYSPHRPEPPQHAFLLLDELDVYEALYGGAAGGGKSDALLMAALRYVDVPGYSALLLRRTYPELTQADGLITRSHLWLAGTDAVWKEADHVWTFPSGATLRFGYCATRKDRLRYQGGAYQFVGFDELTHFPKDDYLYLSSRIRRPTDGPLSRVPLRLRGATNPGGPGHDWVLSRLINREPDPEDPDDTPEAAAARIFIPARLEDNPHLDADAYRRSLAVLGPVERRRLELGEWDVDTGDRVYDRAGVRAALWLGELLDRAAAAGELPPPADTIASGIDYGEHTHGLIGYPLPLGGLYIVAGEEFSATEISVSSSGIFDLAAELPAWPGRRKVRDPLTLVGELRYDPGSAGAQSIRTTAPLARRRHPRIKTKAIPFGNYKREAIDYVSYLLARSAQVAAGELTLDDYPYLAISPKAPELRRQLPAYKKDESTGEPIKDDDHGPDALVAVIAPIARKYRDRAEAERARIVARAQAVTERLPRP